MTPLLWSLLACTGGPALPDAAPHTIVVLVLDTVRPDRLGPYGGPDTPAIQAIADRGAIYTHARAAAPWTLPSHVTLFTGLEPAEHGSHHGNLRYTHDAPLLAQRMHAAGYATGGFSNNPWITQSTGLATGFDTFVEVFKRSATLSTAVNRFVSPQFIGMSDAGGLRALAAVDQWLELVDGQPAFLFVNLVEAHLPFDPPDGWRGRAHTRVPLLSEVHEFHDNWLLSAHQPDRLDPAAHAELTARAGRLYDEEIAYVDHLVGRLDSTLAQHGRTDDTLFVLTADHGEAFGDHSVDGIRLIDHQLSLYDELLRVPLVLRWPGVVHPQRIDTPVGHVGLTPLLEWAASGRQGAQPALTGTGAAEPLRASYHPPLAHEDMLRNLVPDAATRTRLVHRGYQAVQLGAHKLLKPSDSEPMLFDLENDPGETRDIAALHPDLVQELGDLLPPPLGAGGAEADGAGIPDETVEALRALGYVR